jgi:hypothetical protein
MSQIELAIETNEQSSLSHSFSNTCEEVGLVIELADYRIIT